MMGSNQSKFCVIVQTECPIIEMECLAPPHVQQSTSHKIIIHRPIVSSSYSDTDEDYIFPVFLSSPYLEMDIVKISSSDSE